jgi:hypothetical protein
MLDGRFDQHFVELFIRKSSDPIDALHRGNTASVYVAIALFLTVALTLALSLAAGLLTAR